MEAMKKLTMSLVLVAAAFAGGGFAQWLLMGSGVAYAARHVVKTTTAKTVQAREFVLVDAKRRVRARLAVGTNGPVMVMKNERGNNVLGLGFWRGGAGLAMNSTMYGARQGKAQFTLGVSADGEDAGLDITDMHGNTVIMLGTRKD